MGPGSCIAELVAILVRLPSRSERREQTREVDAGHGGSWGGSGEVRGDETKPGKGNLDV